MTWMDLVWSSGWASADKGRNWLFPGLEGKPMVVHSPLPPQSFSSHAAKILDPVVQGVWGLWSGGRGWRISWLLCFLGKTPSSLLNNVPLSCWAEAAGWLEISPPTTLEVVLCEGSQGWRIPRVAKEDFYLPVQERKLEDLSEPKNILSYFSTIPLFSPMSEAARK